MRRRYLNAKARWNAAGRPTRPRDKREALLNDCCRPCEHFRKLGRIGQCKLCGCLLNLGTRFSKLAMATEGCPDNPPKFTADVTVEDTPVCEPDLSAEDKARRKRRRRRVRAQQQQEAVAASVKTSNSAHATEAKLTQRQIERAYKQTAPELADYPEKKDPLRTFDRERSELTGHPFRNLWWPAPAFLIGGGPSLKGIDLAFLRQRGVMSLAINNAAAYAPARAIVFGDPPEKFHHGVMFDGAIMKWAPQTMMGKRVRRKKSDGSIEWTRYNLNHCPNAWGFSRDGLWEPDQFFSRPSATWGCGKGCKEQRPEDECRMTFFCALRLLHYFGVKRVYLLGVDFNMHGHYAFNQDRTDDAVLSNNRYYHVAARFLEQLKPVFDNAGFAVFNCNPESRLSVFPHVSLSDAVDDCRSLVPPEPLDCSGYYEKPGEDGHDYRGDES